MNERFADQFTGSSAARTQVTRGPPHLLVVDDDPDICELMRHLLEGEGYAVTTTTTAHDALERIVSQTYDLMLTDVTMPEMDGIALCQKVAGVRPGLPIVLLTGRADIETATRAVRVGVRDFLTKPLDSAALVASVTRLIGHPDRQRCSALPPEIAGQPSELRLAGLLGESEAMRCVRRLILDLCESVASVVIQGETGSGKEIIAQALHSTSPLSGGPFIALNCAAMPAGLLESELFGHARGAFTDAKTAKKGLLLQAEGGTLLLDEISELPLLMQPKLLRALQERTVRPIGEHREIPFNCRIIAAANQDLEVEVKAKRFREDLFYRLDVIRIAVPPLRARGGDILLLAQHFLSRFVSRSRRALELSEPAAAKLLAYDWPGNVRELENCMERAVALARGDELSIDDLPERIQAHRPLVGMLPLNKAPTEPTSPRYSTRSASTCSKRSSSSAATRPRRPRYSVSTGERFTGDSYATSPIARSSPSSFVLEQLQTQDTRRIPLGASWVGSGLARGELMQTSKVLMMLGTALASSRLGRDVRAVELNDVLGMLGLSRRRSYLLENLALFGAGAAVGAGVALLLAPTSGIETRKRLSQGVEKLGDQAAEKLRQAQDELSARDRRAPSDPSHVS